MKRAKITIFILGACLWLGANAQINIVEAIYNGNVGEIEQFVDEGADVNAELGKSQMTLLMYAIQFKNLDAVKMLLAKGANPNKVAQNISPLIYAVKTNQPEIVSSLATNGANLEQTDVVGRSPLMYAIMQENAAMLGHLVKYGANIHFLNRQYYNALDYAYIYNLPSVVGYLETMGAKRVDKKMQSTTDGPYIYYVPDEQYSAKWLVHDSIKGKSYLSEEKITGNKFISLNDTLTFRKEKRNAKTVYYTRHKVLAIGDVHGDFNGLVAFLKGSGVITNSGSWNFGKGHIVFVGDLFDRGDKVTETLWFVYKLEQQAEAAGGKVHLIIGNHEIMALSGDNRYLHSKYYKLCSNSHIEYKELFTQETVLGKWLRNKNAIVQINKDVFVHAGISPVFANAFESLSQANTVFSNHLRTGKTNDDVALIDSPYGLFWYRGYFKSNKYYDKLPENELNAILKKYGIRSIVIGHTEMHGIETHYNNKVFAINVPFEEEGTQQQALLIEKNTFSILKNDGTREIIRE